MSQPLRSVSTPWFCHLADEEYHDLIMTRPCGIDHMRRMRRARRAFVARWPDLAAWMAAPVADRLLHSAGITNQDQRAIVAGQRFYLCALAMHGRIRLDYPWLIASSLKNLPLGPGAVLGFGPGWLAELEAEAARIGYQPQAARAMLSSACTRIALHKADADWRTITAADLRQLRDEIGAFRDRADARQLRPCLAERSSGVQTWYRTTRTTVHVTHVVLHSLGYIPEQARVVSLAVQPHALPAGPPAMERVIDRYLNRVVPNRTRNRNNMRGRFRTLTTWLAAHHPEVTNFAQLTRAHLEAFMTWLRTDYRHYRTGEPVSIGTQVATISVLNVFLRTRLPGAGTTYPTGHC